MRWTILSSVIFQAHTNDTFISLRQTVNIVHCTHHHVIWFLFTGMFFWLHVFPDSPAALAQILREVRESMTSMQTVLDRYASLLDTNRPEVHVLQVATSLFAIWILLLCYSCKYLEDLACMYNVSTESHQLVAFQVYVAQDIALTSF